MTIDPRRLHVLLAVARNGGVVAAADELKVSPSAISQQLTKLEQEMGQVLVHRTTRGTTLTAAGLTMAQAAEDVERVLEAAVQSIAHDDADVAGVVRIGAFSSFVRSVLVPHLTTWRERFPQVRVELVEDDYVQLARLLRRGDIDALVVELDAAEGAAPLAPGVVEEPLLDEPWKLVVPAGTTLGVDGIDLDRMSLPWLGVDESSASWAAARRLRRSTGAETTTMHQYYETTTALALVAAGEGVALVPALALSETVPDGVDVLEMHGLGTRRIVLRSTRKRAHTPLGRTALGLVREAAAGFDPR